MNNYLRTLLAIIALQFGATQLLMAGELSVHSVAATNAWTRATTSAQQVAGAYMMLSSVEDIRLVSASSPRATGVEIHEMSMVGNIMQMRELPNGLALKREKPVELKPGGIHLMLMGLKAQLKEGASIPLTLTFETKDKKRSTLKVDVEVRDVTSGGTSSATMPQ